MDELKLLFNESITTTKSQLDHIQMNVCVANVPRDECKFGVIKSYWPNFHKAIHIAFKLLKTLLMYNKKPLTSSFF
jgi:hypothetical protein